MTPTATKYAAVVARLTDLTNVLRSRAGAIEHIDRSPARLGSAGRGPAGQGSPPHGLTSHGQARPGETGRDPARQGKAPLHAARRGPARRTHGAARLDRTRLPYSRPGKTGPGTA
jgi:hypothetical protein